MRNNILKLKTYQGSKKTMSFDKFFKIALLIILCGFIYIGYLFTQKGRYELIHYQEDDYTWHEILFDKQTGSYYRDVWIDDKAHWVKEDLIKNHELYIKEKSEQNSEE